MTNFCKIDTFILFNSAFDKGVYMLSFKFLDRYLVVESYNIIFV